MATPLAEGYIVRSIAITSVSSCKWVDRVATVLIAGDSKSVGMGGGARGAIAPSQMQQGSLAPSLHTPIGHKA